jgi:hypothetical protein
MGDAVNGEEYGEPAETEDAEREPAETDDAEREPAETEDAERYHRGRTQV